MALGLSQMGGVVHIAHHGIRRTDEHLLTVTRYVERNAPQVKLVRKAKNNWL
jgi:hypothetical protein